MAIPALHDAGSGFCHKHQDWGAIAFCILYFILISLCVFEICIRRMEAEYAKTDKSQNDRLVCCSLFLCIPTCYACLALGVGESLKEPMDISGFDASLPDNGTAGI